MASIKTQFGTAPVEGQRPTTDDGVLANDQRPTTNDGVLVTPKALQHIRAAMQQQGISPAEGGLRLGIQGGGCSGMNYAIQFDTQPRAYDRIFQFADIRVFIDPKSLVFLKGTTLDWEDSLMRQGFVFRNPNVASQCGCGTSFSV